MNRRVLGMACLLALCVAPAARANDSSAEMAAGGLVLTQSRDIDMVSEDLFISAEQIRVRYVFRNRSRRDVTTIVAFPMPDRDLRLERESDVGWPSDFATEVDGRPVAMQVERKAMARGIDQSALLTRLGVPITYNDNGTDDLVRAIARLPRADQDRLESLGLIETYGEGANRDITPIWTVKETWHWQQTFPAGRDLNVSHRYAPGAGGSATSVLSMAEFRTSEYAREMIDRYCIDPPFLAAVDRLRARTGTEYATLADTWLSYILTTGANWRAPIGDFRLVVDKGRPENLVSFCGEGVRRISPTQFEMRRRNFRPTRDLRILIIRPYRYDE